MPDNYTGASAGVHTDEPEPDPKRTPKPARVDDMDPSRPPRKAKPTDSADRGPNTTTRGNAQDAPDPP